MCEKYYTLSFRSVLLRSEIVLHGEAEVLLKARKRLPDHSLGREKDVIGVEPVRIHIHMGVDPRLLQMPDIVQRLTVEGTLEAEASLGRHIHDYKVVVNNGQGVAASVVKIGKSGDLKVSMIGLSSSDSFAVRAYDMLTVDGILAAFAADDKAVKAGKLTVNATGCVIAEGKKAIQADSVVKDSSVVVWAGDSEAEAAVAEPTKETYQKKYVLMRLVMEKLILIQHLLWEILNLQVFG